MWCLICAACLLAYLIKQLEIENSKNSHLMANHGLHIERRQEIDEGRPSQASKKIRQHVHGVHVSNSVN
jgi:hypothetical protein